MALEAQSQRVEMVGQAFAAGARPVERQARRLVDHQRLGVFEQDRKLDAAHATAPAIRRSASSSSASEAAKLMRKP